MKNKIKIACITCFALLTFSNILLNNKPLSSDLILENIEALAQHGEFNDAPLERGYEVREKTIWLPPNDWFSGGSTTVKCCKSSSSYSGCARSFLGDC